MFNIEMLPAGHGDCLYIEYGDPTAPSRVLIDGGPYYAFDDLAGRIDSLAAGAAPLELFVVTHMDCDHIDGAVKLLGVQASRQVAREVWFNARRHLEPAGVLGAREGEFLNALVPEEASWLNTRFDGQAVLVSDKDPLLPVQLPGGLELTLLSPTADKLARLRPVWDDEVRKAGLEGASREKVLDKLRGTAHLQPPSDLLGGEPPDELAKKPFRGDRSAANGSSIAFLAEYRSGTERKSCLFTGDAHAAVLARSISRLLAQRKEPKLTVDAVKLAHHGSKGNTSPSLLALLGCRKFLISTNGERFGHPDDEAIARVIVQSGPGVRLFFNYDNEHTAKWKNGDWQEQFDYTARYPDPDSKGFTVSL